MERTRLDRIRPYLLAIGAKLLCSALFVSGRERSEALANSVSPRLGQRRGDVLADVEVDHEAGLVCLTGPDGSVGRARFLGDQGATILRDDTDEVEFDPVPVRSALPDANAQPWPLGDADALADLDAPSSEGLARAADEAFEPAAHTAAFLVVHRGRIVLERYADGVGQHTQLESWSMGKSITATLIGLLIERGALALDQPAPIPEWQQPGDRRAAITIRDLLQMSSGLRFSGGDDRVDGVTDHVRIYMEPMDAFDFACRAEPEHPPQRVGRYRNCDPLVLGRIVRDLVRAGGDEYLTWPQRALFDEVGVRRQVLECDLHGNFLMTGFDYATARNWARLGMLYLRDGCTDRGRLLPEGFVDFCSSPAPAWSTPEYGGLFWLNRTQTWNLPDEAFSMSGDGCQRCIIVPSLDAVIVRMGHTAGSSAAAPALNRALAHVTRALS